MKDALGSLRQTLVLQTIYDRAWITDCLSVFDLTSKAGPDMITPRGFGFSQLGGHLPGSPVSLTRLPMHGSLTTDSPRQLRTCILKPSNDRTLQQPIWTWPHHSALHDMSD